MTPSNWNLTEAILLFSMRKVCVGHALWLLHVGQLGLDGPLIPRGPGPGQSFMSSVLTCYRQCWECLAETREDTDTLLRVNHLRELTFLSAWCSRACVCLFVCDKTFSVSSLWTAAKTSVLVWKYGYQVRHPKIDQILSYFFVGASGHILKVRARLAVVWFTHSLPRILTFFLRPLLGSSRQPLHSQSESMLSVYPSSHHPLQLTPFTPGPGLHNDSSNNNNNTNSSNNNNKRI